jgi:hypothetical protein
MTQYFSVLWILVLIRIQIRRVRASDQWIRLRILLFSSLTFKTPKTYFFLSFTAHKSQNSRNQDFSYYFCSMIKGAGAGSGSVPPFRNFKGTS